MTSTNLRSAAAWTVMAGVLGITASAGAGLSHSIITSPGGFMQAGSYDVTCGCGDVPGADLTWIYGAGMDFHEMAFTGAGSVTQSASGAIGDIQNSAGGTTGLGYLRLAAFNASPASAPFAAGAVNGGWKETFTVSHPSLNGEPGYMIFQIRYRGSVEAAGPAGAAGITTTGYKNEGELGLNPYFDRGATDPVGSDRQRATFGTSSFGPAESRTIDSVVTMSVPITFGQTFTLGIYGRAVAGQRSSGASPIISTATVNFSDGGITWNGITDVKTGAGASVTGYSITSGSGVDWSGPYTECTADLGGDGLVDFADYLEFLNRFDAQDPSVDFTGDGLVDFADYLEFLNLYEAGC